MDCNQVSIHACIQMVPIRKHMKVSESHVLYTYVQLQLSMSCVEVKEYMHSCGRHDRLDHIFNGVLVRSIVAPPESPQTVSL